MAIQISSFSTDNTQSFEVWGSIKRSFSLSRKYSGPVGLQGSQSDPMILDNVTYHSSYLGYLSIKMEHIYVSCVHTSHLKVGVRAVWAPWSSKSYRAKLEASHLTKLPRSTMYHPVLIQSVCRSTLLHAVHTSRFCKAVMSHDLSPTIHLTSE